MTRKFNTNLLRNTRHLQFLELRAQILGPVVSMIGVHGKFSKAPCYSLVHAMTKL